MTEKKDVETQTPVEDKSPLDSRIERLRVLSEGLPESVWLFFDKFHRKLDQVNLIESSHYALSVDTDKFGSNIKEIREVEKKVMEFLTLDAKIRGCRLWSVASSEHSITTYHWEGRRGSVYLATS